MPVVIVYGVPARLRDSESLKSFILAIQRTVAGVREMMLGPDQVSVFIPEDLCREGLGEELIVFVQGLFTTPERTIEVFRHLAADVTETVWDKLAQQIPQCRLVEVFVVPFDPQRGGFAVWRREKETA